MGPDVRLGGWVRCFAPPLGGVVCRGHVLYPAFALGFGQLGFWSVCIFCPSKQGIVLLYQKISSQGI